MTLKFCVGSGIEGRQLIYLPVHFLVFSLFLPSQFCWVFLFPETRAAPGTHRKLTSDIVKMKKKYQSHIPTFRISFWLFRMHTFISLCITLLLGFLFLVSPDCLTHATPSSQRHNEMPKWDLTHRILTHSNVIFLKLPFWSIMSYCQSP